MVQYFCFTRMTARLAPATVLVRQNIQSAMRSNSSQVSVSRIFGEPDPCRKRPCHYREALLLPLVPPDSHASRVVLLAELIWWLLVRPRRSGNRIKIVAQDRLHGRRTMAEGRMGGTFLAGSRDLGPNLRESSTAHSASKKKFTLRILSNYTHLYCGG